MTSKERAAVKAEVIAEQAAEKTNGAKQAALKAHRTMRLAKFDLCTAEAVSALTQYGVKSKQVEAYKREREQKKLLVP